VKLARLLDLRRAELVGAVVRRRKGATLDDLTEAAHGAFSSGKPSQ
jgi:hypothetical protein